MAQNESYDAKKFIHDTNVIRMSYNHADSFCCEDFGNARKYLSNVALCEYAECCTVFPRFEPVWEESQIPGNWLGRESLIGVAANSLRSYDKETRIKSLELGLEVRQAVYGAFMALYDFSDGEKDYDSLLEAKKTLWELVSGYDEKLFNELQKKK
jgi:hypothetical protein